MRLPTPEHVAILADTETWSDNPFGPRAAQRDVKRKQALKSSAWLAGIMTVLLAAALYGISLLRESGSGMPWYLGDEVGTALCIVFAGVHVWFILAEKQRHTTAMLALEAFRDTLSGLLMLPDPPFRMLVQAAAYPWWSGMRVALVGLPLYVLCVWLQGITWADLGMLYLVYALVALGFPVWRRPARSDSPTVVLPSQPAQNQPSAANAMPGGRGANTPNETTIAAAAGVVSPLSIFPALIAPCIVLLNVFARNQGIDTLYAALDPYLPHEILVLLPSFVLSWPLLLARLLITPLGWFGLALPPLVWLPVAMLISAYLQVLRTAEFLSVGTYRDLARQETYLPRRRLTDRLRWALTAILLGYLWPWMVRDDGLRFLLPPPATLSATLDTATAGQQGLVYLLLLVVYGRMVWRVSALVNWPRSSGGENGIVRVAPPTSLAKFLVEPLLTALALYLMGCLLGGVTPWFVGIGMLAGRMLAVIAGGLLLAYGGRRAVGGLVAGTLFLPLVGLLVFGGASARPLAVFSPLLGLIRLGNPGLLGPIGPYVPALPWWHWALGGAVCGLLLSGLAELTARARRAPDVRREDAEVLRVDPTLVGAEVFLDRNTAIQSKEEGVNASIAPRLVAAITRYWDNPLLVKELRVRLRRVTLRTVLLVAVIYLVITLLLVASPIPALIGGGIASGIWNRPLPAGANILVGLLGIWYVGVVGITVGTAFVGLTAFSVDRDKSTLGFVLLTPLKARSILLGKAVGMLTPSVLLFGSMLLWTLLLSLALVPTVGYGPLVVWGQVAVTAALVWSTLSMCMIAFASLVRNPRQIMAGCYFVFFVVPQIAIQVLLHWWRGIPRRPVRRVPRRVRRRGGLIAWLSTLHMPPGTILWLILLVLCVLVLLMATALGIWGVRRMRRGDLAFAASRREN